VSAPGWHGGAVGVTYRARGRAGQGGQGQSSPKRQRGVEVVEDASGGGIQRWRGSFGDG
jgi:hypothetical protein